MKNILNKNKGITLIALVITIIVLLILTGITIASLTGENGLLKRAENAKENQRGGTVQDEVALALAENEIIENLNKTKENKENKKTKADVVADLLAKGYLREDEAETLETEDIIKIGSITIDFSKLGSAESRSGIWFKSQQIVSNWEDIYTQLSFTRIADYSWDVEWQLGSFGKILTSVSIVADTETGDTRIVAGECTFLDSEGLPINDTNWDIGEFDGDEVNLGVLLREYLECQDIETIENWTQDETGDGY
ncbi:MAG: type II secretion system protein [Clostridia bacterium]|nr:type II secretion system protein [Clostridia bacterium]